MDTIIHLAANAVLGAALAKGGIIESWGIYLLFVSFAALIDIDHIIYMIISEHSISAKKIIPIMKAYRTRMEPHLYIFHSPEFLFITALLALNHYIWGLLLASNLLHLSLDSLQHYLHNKNWDEFYEWSISLAIWRRFMSR